MDRVNVIRRVYATVAAGGPLVIAVISVTNGDAWGGRPSEATTRPAQGTLDRTQLWCVRRASPRRTCLRDKERATPCHYCGQTSWLRVRPRAAAGSKATFDCAARPARPLLHRRDGFFRGAFLFWAWPYWIVGWCFRPLVGLLFNASGNRVPRHETRNVILVDLWPNRFGD